MPTATIKSPMVTGMLWSKTSGMVGSEARGSSNTALFSSSLSGMLRRNTTMLKNANGMSRRGKAIRYMPVAFLHAGVARKTPTRGAPRRAKFRARSCKLELGSSPPSDLFLRLEDLPAAVHAGLEIDVVGPAQLARILVLHIGRPRQRIGGAAHPAPRRRCFAFRNGHAVLSSSLGNIRRKPCAPAAFGSRAYRGSRASRPGPRTDRAAFAITLIIWRFSRRTRAPPGP